jgi:hypothetical protein
MPACERAGAAIGRELGMTGQATSEDLTQISASAMATAQLPPLRGLFELCPPNGRAIARQRHDACVAVFLRLSESHDLLLHGIGVRALAEHAATGAERARWRERQRELEWLMQQGSPLMRPSLMPLAWEQGEVAVLTALLEQAGRWPVPPGWTPEAPQVRAQVGASTRR